MPQEREDLRKIQRLQSMNIYPQLVRKLTERESARSVARWAMEQHVEGPAGAWGLGFWLKHLWVLRRDVIAAKERLRCEEHRRRRTVAPVRPDPEAVLAKVDAIIESKTLMDFIPKEAQKLLQHVMAGEKEIRSIHLLQVAAVASINRLERIKKLEDSMPVILLPEGRREIDNLRKIAEALLKNEIAAGWLRGRCGHMPIAVPESEDPGLADIAKTMLEFDDVDRNIVRELGARFIEMAQEAVSGRWKRSDWKEKREKLNQDLVNRLTPPARKKFVDSLLPKLINKPDRAASNMLYARDYLWPPVSVQEFVEGKQYLGNILRGNIYPKILNDLIELFEGRYSEVLLTGAIGWGKSLMAEVGIAYDIYKVSCLKNPADAFGLIPNSNIAFINVSVDKRQATKVLFGGIGNLIRKSPYFREKFPYDANITTELRFPRGVVAYPVAASEQALLGESVFSAAFDEMNFYAVVEKSKQHPERGTYDQAFQLYTKMSTRIRSRMNKRGMLPGHLWTISSARYPNDFTERKAVEALTDKTIFVRQYSAWETKPRSDFMAEEFEVEVGDVTRRSRVLDGSETDVNRNRVITVPMDYKAEFEKDPHESVRDFGGVPVLSIRPFIGRRDMITEMMQRGKAAGLQHPFTDFTVTLQLEHDHLIPERLDWIDDKDGRKRINDGPYYAHIDLAKVNDPAGFAVAHVVGSKQVSRGFGREQKYETRPIIRIDLALEIVAPPRGEISIASVRGLLYQLRDLGLQFQLVTYDSFASEDSIQILKAEGFSADNLSVDTDTAPYEALREAIYDGRLLCYEHPRLAMQLATVRKDEKTGQIDHPVHGQKDISDSVAGVVWHAEKSFAEGTTAQWLNVRGIQTSAPEPDDSDLLWEKVYNNIPLTEAEIARLK